MLTDCYKKKCNISAFLYVVQHVFLRGEMKRDKYFYNVFDKNNLHLT